MTKNSWGDKSYGVHGMIWHGILKHGYQSSQKMSLISEFFVVKIFILSHQLQIFCRQKLYFFVIQIKICCHHFQICCHQFPIFPILTGKFLILYKCEIQSSKHVHFPNPSDCFLNQIFILYSIIYTAQCQLFSKHRNTYKLHTDPLDIHIVLFWSFLKGILRVQHMSLFP